METYIEKMRAEIKQANRTFTIQIISALVAAVAAGAALGHYFIK